MPIATASSPSAAITTTAAVVGCVCIVAVGSAIGLGGSIHSPSPSPSHTRGAGVQPACPTATGWSRAEEALSAARRRYLLESDGTVARSDLRRIAGDKALLADLRARRLRLALAEAKRQLVRHVVRIRVLRGSRAVVDANPSSFDVGGPSVSLHVRGGEALGRLQITVQDVIGYVKLVHKLNAADVVVRGTRGEAHASVPGAAKLALPASGCAYIGRRRYIVRSFTETGFAQEPLTIWVLTNAQ
jgi:hypothetical protein